VNPFVYGLLAYVSSGSSVITGSASVRTISNKKPASSVDHFQPYFSLSLPLSATHRLLNTHDFILMLLELMELQVWTKPSQDGGHPFAIEIYEIFMF
jgi:hypothetical protein